MKFGKMGIISNGVWVIFICASFKTDLSKIHKDYTQQNFSNKILSLNKVGLWYFQNTVIDFLYVFKGLPDEQWFKNGFSRTNY